MTDLGVKYTEPAFSLIGLRVTKICNYNAFLAAKTSHCMLV
ncbi:hypothetical protein BFV96_2125 [Alteromonas macleodii]|uniref:Uncharacterized protein n=1 Tax=Alteromonas macleodii TaxID=28108 RepID=A0AB36FU96_ALTMA|nr:hypothetical protein BFV95_2138 [Alteromonas macleodii]OES32281.1 hypothetical protein BFV93_2130 [Alteromonas macleodii]OES41262.1 hypothetical protein BFV96_2125 [Alteromonas macleodii]